MRIFVTKIDGTEMVYTQEHPFQAVRNRFGIPKNFTSEQIVQEYFRLMLADKMDDMVYTMNINTILNLKVPCLLPSEFDASKGSNYNGCASEFDSNGICWPTTLANYSVTVPCSPNPLNFDNDQRGNAFVLAKRICHENGTWDNIAFDPCGDDNKFHSKLPDLEYIEHIWTGGYLVSLVALLIGITIFMYCKNHSRERTRQNMIHVNLISSYILTSLQWFLSLGLAIVLKQTECQRSGVLYKFSTILELYFNLTTITWMLVEGMYLIIKTYFNDRMSLKTYAFIGWGFPAVIIAYWTAVKSFNWGVDADIFIIAAYFTTQWFKFTMDEDILLRTRRHKLRVYLSVLFLIRMIMLLIDEMRFLNSTTLRKATNAALMVISLIGISYLTLFSAPAKEVGKGINEVFHTIHISTQALLLVLYK